MSKIHGSSQYGTDAKDQPELILNDKERLDWLDKDSNRLEDVRGCMENESLSIREAIDYLINKQS